ncbi:MAG TPA: hypothetical protein VN823_24280 [Stellaceae bacterium]|nr:hypothetical protein [Stellaceae bacterium]
MRWPIAFITAFAVLQILSPAMPASAQVSEKGPTAPTIRPTGEPRLPPGPPTLQGSSDLIASSSANEHGTYVWIVGPIEHIVVLCEKTDITKELTCTTHRLP